MYQRPTYHWKLECYYRDEYSVVTALDELRNMIDEEPLYVPMLKSYKAYGIFAFIFYTVFTFIPLSGYRILRRKGGKPCVCIVPLIGMIVGSLLMLKPMMTTNELNNLLESE